MSYYFNSTRATVVAAKQHICDQCGKPIQKGTIHSYTAGKYDGDFYTAREHNDCRELWLKLWDVRGLLYGDTQDVLISDGDLYEDKEWIAAEYPDVAARLWPSLVPA